jgi:hypothetical protein
MTKAMKRVGEFFKSQIEFRLKTIVIKVSDSYCGLKTD